mgnify:CR=1 FL=1
MTNYKVGIQLTKNKDKYKQLIKYIDSSKLGNFTFIYIQDNKSLKQEIKTLDILVRKPS